MSLEDAILASLDLLSLCKFLNFCSEGGGGGGCAECVGKC